MPVDLVEAAPSDREGIAALLNAYLHELAVHREIEKEIRVRGGAEIVRMVPWRGSPISCAERGCFSLRHGVSMAAG